MKYEPTLRWTIIEESIFLVIYSSNSRTKQSLIPALFGTEKDDFQRTREDDLNF